MRTLTYCIIESPVGRLKLMANDEALQAIVWEKEKENRVKLENIEEASDHPLLLHTQRQLTEYFNHQRKEFDLPLLAEGTPFQQSVWQVLSEIPYGTTWTYKQVAETINHPKAVRAVGSAIGRNPISIIIPCHRVIATGGGLGGFAGGLDKKTVLLDLEREFHCHFS